MAMTKKIAGLEHVAASRLVLMYQRFRKTCCYTSMEAGSSEKPVYVKQTTLRHIIIL